MKKTLGLALVLPLLWATPVEAKQQRYLALPTGKAAVARYADEKDPAYRIDGCWRRTRNSVGCGILGTATTWTGPAGAESPGNFVIYVFATRSARGGVHVWAPLWDER